MKLKYKLYKLLTVVIISFTPCIAMAELTPEELEMEIPTLPPGPPADGGEPQFQPDVPFDTNMNLVFLAGGLFFAGMIIYKHRIGKEATASRNF